MTWHSFELLPFWQKISWLMIYVRCSVRAHVVMFIWKTYRDWWIVVCYMTQQAWWISSLMSMLWVEFTVAPFLPVTKSMASSYKICFMQQQKTSTTELDVFVNCHWKTHWPLFVKSDSLYISLIFAVFVQTHIWSVWVNLRLPV